MRRLGVRTYFQAALPWSTLPFARCRPPKPCFLLESPEALALPLPALAGVEAGGGFSSLFAITPKRLYAWERCIWVVSKFATRGVSSWDRKLSSLKFSVAPSELVGGEAPLVGRVREPQAQDGAIGIGKQVSMHGLVDIIIESCPRSFPLLLVDWFFGSKNEDPHAQHKASV